MDKLERLLTLTATLLDTSRPLTADELRERVAGYPDNLAAFRRAFERDKDDLREMGVPLVVEMVETTARPVEGYRIRRDDYELRDPGLDPDELAALNLAAALVRLDGVPGIEALWKLGGVAPAPDAQRAGGGAQLAALPTEPALVPVFGAVVERRPITFRYRREDRVGERTIDPHRLDYRQGRWYVTGFDHGAQGERRFRLDRVEGEVRAGAAASFEPPELAPDDRPARPWEFGEGEPVVARLLVDADQAVWARRHLGDDAVEATRPDGATTFAVPVTQWPAFRSFVLTFLDHAELLGPPAQRADLVGWLEAIAAGGGTGR